ncbi:hypothetical protein BRC2024_KCUCJSVR_CDS_0004 [Acinetobacter phage vB_AbaM_KissB]
MEFDIGTKVVCVDDSNQKVLKRGNIYTVKDMDVVGYRSRVWIEEYRRFSFSTNRFQKVESING